MRAFAIFALVAGCNTVPAMATDDPMPRIDRPMRAPVISSVTTIAGHAVAEVQGKDEDGEEGEAVDDEAPVICKTGEDLIKYGPRCGVMNWQSQ